MSDNVRSFQADLKELAKKLDISIGLVITKISLDAWSRITQRTPVDTGRARASWTLKEGQPSDFVPSEGSSGQPSPPAASFDGKTSVFVTSNLDYIRYLEQGSSNQAPAGMVAITLAELEAEAESIIGSPA